jgi:hypothetical protein
MREEVSEAVCAFVAFISGAGIGEALSVTAKAETAEKVIMAIITQSTVRVDNRFILFLPIYVV